MKEIEVVRVLDRVRVGDRITFVFQNTRTGIRAAVILLRSVLYEISQDDARRISDIILGNIPANGGRMEKVPDHLDDVAERTFTVRVAAPIPAPKLTYIAHYLECLVVEPNGNPAS